MSIHSPTSHYFPKVYQKENQIPTPSHRHAAPSAPWPWINIHDEVDAVQLASRLPPVPPLCDHTSCDSCWTGYPQSRFPNWTKDQVSRSKISDAIVNYRRNAPCIIYRADVRDDGFFENVESMTAYANGTKETWDQVIHTNPPPNIRVRAMFVENLSGPVLQMLGTRWAGLHYIACSLSIASNEYLIERRTYIDVYCRYNIEPFFFSSSLNWIPSRFQEDIQPKKGDHITVTLTFLKSLSLEPYNRQHRGSRASFRSIDMLGSQEEGATLLSKQMIDTQAPLRLRFSNRQLVLDLLSVHLIRHLDGSTIISFHPDINHPTTKAGYLHERIRFAGQSVYWQSIFQKSPDPTFVLLTFIWHAMYAWDEALEDLYAHICQLETRVISTSNTVLTQELHVIRAHQLHYSSLLEDFRKTVDFVGKTRNPAMESYPKAIRDMSAELMARECANLKHQIERLEMGRKMQDKRLRNVMNLVFSSVNIEDSKRMAQMTEAAVKDSAAMKQIAYLTMIFLPATFASGIFGMNIQEINPGTNGTVGHYAATAISFTMATVWIIIAFQSKHIFGEDTSFWQRLGWPYMLFRKHFKGKACVDPKISK